MVPDPTRVTLDKRKHPRISVNIPATYRSGSLTLDTSAANLSQTGAFLVSRSVDPVGTVAEVILAFGRTLLRLTGRVVWHHEKGMGVCFENLSRDQRLTLANFLIARFCR